MKNVLITGAAKRIGRALSEHFAAKGWKVFIHCNSSRTDAESLQKDLMSRGQQADVLCTDLADQNALERTFRSLFESEKIDCVINNASVFEYDSPTNIDAQVFQGSMAVNLFAPIKIAELYHHAHPATGGCLINILDNKLEALNPDYYSYTLAKAALLSATKMMAMSYGPTVRVNAIAPSVMLASGPQTQEQFEQTHCKTLLKKGVQVGDIAHAAEFIAESPAYHGQVLTLDAGQSLMNLERDVAFLSPKS